LAEFGLLYFNLKKMIKLQPQERIHLLKRRHPIVLKLQILPPASLLFLFFFLLCFFSHEISWPQFLIEKFPEISTIKLNFVFAFLFSLTLPIFWLFIFLEITRYFLTYWVVTNQRIIEARFVGLFNIQYSSVELDKIQDMTAKIKGFLPSFFHFGDLRIQTAGEKGEFILDQIEDPELVKQVIFEAKFDYQKAKT
jgi:uncharacterized membrane protein YdbT with pleckstrin-like domain